MTTATAVDARRDSFRAGVRAGLPFAAAGLLLALSLGVYARDVGMGAGATIAMSAIVHAGSAQFAALSIVASGGGVATAVAAAALMNARFLPMGIAIAPSLPGGWVKRAAQGQAVVDSSWAMAARGDGRYDRWFLFGATAPQFCAWVGGTVLGAFAGSAVDPARLGLDAIFPTFFLVLLLNELRNRAAVEVAVVAALIAVALTPVTPPGVPVLAASLAAFIGVRAGSRGPA